MSDFSGIILQQLGGNQFLAMTGCHNLVKDTEKQIITMKLRKNKLKAKWFKVTLNSMDLYDVEFVTLKKNQLVVLKKFEGIYDDMLVNIFESETGLYTKL